ncbi:MAG TPA: SMC-Scp complex subunit ScpB, partial [Acidimicrobiales bacterium]|nr:SMC-Scp complex subunit ScpB [Acidimicrobiales bacterium]
VAGGFRFQSHPAYAGHVERFILDDAPQRLSGAALETLAIIAYKQPISRAQIAQIRGVNADGVVRMLTERGYIGPVGRDDGPGLAILFGTTSLFLERLGLDRIEELPALEMFVPDVDIVEGLERILRPERES